MKKYVSVLVLALFTTATFAVAQLTPSGVVADVPFAFIAGGKTLPAGTYRFAPGGSLTQIGVTDSSGRDVAMTVVVTRLSPRSRDEAALVFDVAGSDHYLAEIYVPGMDGFQVPCAKGDHTHVVVKAKR